MTTIGNSTNYCNYLKHDYSPRQNYLKIKRYELYDDITGQLLLPGVARTPKLNGYYAANLNSVMPTVKSAKPNARLLASII